MFPKSLDQIHRRNSLSWLDKVGLSLAAAVLAIFLVVWLLFILAAGSAPTERLSMLCFEWMTKTLAEVVFPVWFIARVVHAIASRVARAFRPHEKTVLGVRVVQLPGAV